MSSHTYAKEKTMINGIGSTFEKMFKKPLYRLFLFLLGILIMPIVMVKYLSNKKSNNYEELKSQAKKRILGKKELAELETEVRNQLKNKLEFFQKTLSENEFEKQAQAILKERIDEMVLGEIEKNKSYQQINKITFVSTFKQMIHNNVFFMISLILAFPMYILISIYGAPYVKYVFERVIMMFFVLFGVTLLVFTILHLSPMDPATNILGESATHEQILEFNRVYGLDKPFIVQLWGTFKGLFTFNLGNSYAGNEVVFTSIMNKFPVTLNVAFISVLVAAIIAIPAGIISAIKQYSAYDYLFMLLALIGLSIPNFWLGLMLILNFSIKQNILPATYQVGNMLSMVMPAIVLGTALAASVARMTRSSMLEVVKQDYMLTARAKGLSERRVVIKHALQNAMIPIITVIGLQFGGMLGGSAITEKVFNINGIGSYIVDKQFIPDIPIVLAGVVYVAVVISLVNLVVDIIYSFLDPRIKSKMKNY